MANTDDPTANNLFEAGITAYTSSSYGGTKAETFQTTEAMLRTGSFGDGNSYTFIRAVRPRFVGDLPPTQAFLTVTGKVELTTSVAPKGAEASAVSWLSNTQGSMSTFTSDLNVYDTEGLATTTSLTTDPRSPQWFPVRMTGKYIQFSFTFKGDAELMGFDIDYDTTGSR